MDNPDTGTEPGRCMRCGYAADQHWRGKGGQLYCPGGGRSGGDTWWVAILAGILAVAALAVTIATAHNASQCQSVVGQLFGNQSTCQRTVTVHNFGLGATIVLAAVTLIAVLVNVLRKS